MHKQIETYQVRIYGHVQGTGFRLATARQAHALKITGWVRNLDDGSVEACIQGTSDDHMDEMLQWFSFGPAQAQVSYVDIEQLDTDQRFTGFQYR